VCSAAILDDSDTVADHLAAVCMTSFTAAAAAAAG
jgi:hypothetical protein